MPKPPADRPVSLGLGNAAVAWRLDCARSAEGEEVAREPCVGDVVFGTSVSGARVSPYVVQPTRVTIALQSVVEAPKRASSSVTEGEGTLNTETMSLLLRRSVPEASTDDLSDPLYHKDWSTITVPRAGVA